MVTFDARPSAFTQLSTVADWEYLFNVQKGKDALDGFGSFQTGIDAPGRNVNMSAGTALIRAQLWRCDAQIATPIPAASASNRIDRLVLRLNRGATTGPTVVVPTVITGTPSGSPTLPPLVQTPTGLWDFPVCHWTSQSNGGLASLNDDRGLIMNDTWHVLTVPAGWTASWAYKMYEDYSVGFQGWVQLPGSGSYNNITLATLPQAYWPDNMPGGSSDRFHPIVSQGSASYGQNATSTGLPALRIMLNGALQLNGIPAGINSQIVYVDGVRYPIDSF